VNKKQLNLYNELNLLREELQTATGKDYNALEYLIKYKMLRLTKEFPCHTCSNALEGMKNIEILGCHYCDVGHITDNNWSQK